MLSKSETLMGHHEGSLRPRPSYTTGMTPNPYAAPGAPFPSAGGGATGGATLEGDVLVVSKHGHLPDVCIKCAARENIVRRDAKLSWTPTWARLSVVFCTVLGAVAILVTTKRAQLSLPLCAPCNAGWSTASKALIAAVIGLVIGLMSFSYVDPTIGAVVAGLGIAGFVLVMLLFVRPRMVQVVLIDDHVVKLKGFHADAGRILAGH